MTRTRLQDTILTINHDPSRALLGDPVAWVHAGSTYGAYKLPKSLNHLQAF